MIELNVTEKYILKIERENKKLQKRIDKAIEYMNNNNEKHGIEKEWYAVDKDKVIDILKGDDSND